MEKDFLQEHLVTGQGETDSKNRQIQARYQKEVLCCEGAEALEQIVQRSCGCPIPGGVQGQAAWNSEQPGLVESVPAVAEGLKLDDL